VQQNFDTLVSQYVDQNFDAILTQYVAANRDVLIRTYVEQNFDSLLDTYIDQNFNLVLDAVIYFLYTTEEIEAMGMTMEELRQYVLQQYGEDAIREMAKQIISIDQIVAMVSASMTDQE